jgi:hypothetical protein
MDTAARNSPFLDAGAFLRTDQSKFGSASRYELVRGAIVAHAAPSPEHGVILGNRAREIGNRLRGYPGCRRNSAVVLRRNTNSATRRALPMP